MDVLAATDAALDLLLASREPAIRHAALTELLGLSPDDAGVASARRSIADGRLVRALLGGQRSDGGFGVHPYAKWAGAHWRLVSLADLAVPAETPGLREAYETVLDWLLGKGHRAGTKLIAGRWRRCASQEGNALAVGVHLELAGDDRVQELAASLVRWQWPDGGWNCDKSPDAHHASFNETWPALRALARYADATGDPDARASAARGAEFLLRHRVVYSERTAEIVADSMGKLHFPPYWHYDLLAGLGALGAAGGLADPRAAQALDLLEAKRRPDGAWQTGGRWWRRPGSHGPNTDVVAWGDRGPNEPLTLAALRVLQRAGRWRAPA